MQTFPETSQQAEPFRGCEYRYRPVLSFRVAWNALLWLRHHQNLSLGVVPIYGGQVKAAILFPDTNHQGARQSTIMIG